MPLGTSFSSDQTMRLAWLTDIHLDHVSPTRLTILLDEIAESGANALLVGGDISLADDVFHRLEELSRASGLPVYYVLGNHDYYRGSIAEVRREAEARSRAAGAGGPVWLPERGVVELSPDAALVGHGGWGDGTVGDFFGSPVRLNDQLLIKELTRLGQEDLSRALERLGSEAAAHLEPHLRQALTRYPRVVLLTHVPPYLGACWHNDLISGPHWSPHFTCGRMGEMIDRVFADHPGRELTVLCGHTHSAGLFEPRPGVRVYTGSAVYGAPIVQSVTIEV